MEEGSGPTILGRGLAIRGVPLRFAFQVCEESFHGFWAFLMLKEKPLEGKQWEKKGGMETLNLSSCSLIGS